MSDIVSALIALLSEVALGFLVGVIVVFVLFFIFLFVWWVFS